MKKPVIIKHQDHNAMDFLFSELEQNFTAPSVAVSDYIIKDDFLRVETIRNDVESITALFFHEKEITAGMFRHFLRPCLPLGLGVQQICDAQVFISTRKAPLLSPEQEKQVFMYDFPINWNMETIRLFAKVIWIKMQKYAIPSLNETDRNAENLHKYYDRRLDYYGEKLKHHIKHYEMYDFNEIPIDLFSRNASKKEKPPFHKKPNFFTSKFSN